MTEIDFHNSLYKIYLEKQLKAIAKDTYLELKTKLIQKYLEFNPSQLIEVEIAKANRQCNRWQSGIDIEILSFENLARKTCFLQTQKGRKARAERQRYEMLILRGAVKENIDYSNIGLFN